MTDFGTPTFLQLLEPQEVEVLRTLSSRQSYTDGTVIHGQGDTGSAMGIVARGQVRLYRLRRGGQLMYETAILPGQNYGDIVALFHPVRSHQAVAHGDTEVDHISREGFRQILAFHPGIIRALYRVASFRLMVAVEAFDDIRSLSTHVYLAKVLVAMLRSRKSDNRLVCRQEELASMVGISTVSLAKALRKLEGEGLISTGYREIIVPDPDALERWLAVRIWR